MNADTDVGRCAAGEQQCVMRCSPTNVQMSIRLTLNVVSSFRHVTAHLSIKELRKNCRENSSPFSCTCV